MASRDSRSEARCTEREDRAEESGEEGEILKWAKTGRCWYLIEAIVVSVGPGEGVVGIEWIGLVWFWESYGRIEQW